MIFEKMSAETGLPVPQILQIIFSADRRYRTYSIEKRNGGERAISQPSKKLKFIQRWLVHRVFNHMPVHRSATAYVRGKSILDNASAHKSSAYLLKLDFENFFPSITYGNVVSLLSDRKEFLSNIDYGDEESIAKAVCLKGALTIGAPSSPSISNAMLYDFDVSVQNYCDQNSLNYTRYADDIAISAAVHGSLVPAVERVEEELNSLKYPKLMLNRGKTVIVSKKHRRFLTGLVLTSEGEVSIGREQKRTLKSLFFKYKNGVLEKDEEFNLKGWISYINSVEPQFNESLKKKYGADIFIKLMSVVPE